MKPVDLLLENDENPDWDSGTAELGHMLKPGELDLSHKVILYLVPGRKSRFLGSRGRSSA